MDIIWVLLAIVNNVAMNIGIKVSESGFQFLKYICTGGIAVSYSDSV